MLIISTFCLRNFQQKALIVNILPSLSVSGYCYAYALAKTSVKPLPCSVATLKTGLRSYQDIREGELGIRNIQNTEAQNRVKPR